MRTHGSKGPPAHGNFFITLLYAFLSALSVSYFNHTLGVASPISLLPLAIGRGLVLTQSYYLASRKKIPAIGDPLVTLGFVLSRNIDIGKGCAIAFVEAVSYGFGTVGAALILPSDEKILSETIALDGLAYSDLPAFVPGPEQTDAGQRQEIASKIGSLPLPAFYGYPHLRKNFSFVIGFYTEVIASFFVSLAVYHSALSIKTSAAKGSAIVGASLTLCVLTLGRYTGSSVNPLYPTLSSLVKLHSLPDHWWIYWPAAVIGVLLAVIVAQVILAAPKWEEVVDNYNVDVDTHPEQSAISIGERQRTDKPEDELSIPSRNKSK